VALSQDEQRILDEMERNLAADDPRLAARLGSFGQPRLPGHIKIQHARTIGGVLMLALIAAVTVMVFVISPFAHHMQNERGPRGTPSAAAKTTPSSRTPTTTAGHSNSATTKAAKAPAGAKNAKTPAGAKDTKNPTAAHR
jgi:Protein of unknown function (DUF3040)